MHGSIRSVSSSRSSLVPAAAAIFLLAGTPASGTDFKFFPPTAGGTIKLGFKSSTGDNCMPVDVDVLATDTKEQKAQKVRDRINALCGGIFSATVSGDTVTIKNTVRPGQKVFITVTSDDTGEKDHIRHEAWPAWWTLWSDGTWYEVSGASTGLSRANNASVGSITIGTPTWVSVVPTSPGQSPLALLTLARDDLALHGVTNVVLVDLGGGNSALNFALTDADDYLEFGSDDLGLVHSLDMLMNPTASVPLLSTPGQLALIALLAVGGLLSSRRRWTPEAGA